MSSSLPPIRSLVLLLLLVLLNSCSPQATPEQGQSSSPSAPGQAYSQAKAPESVAIIFEEPDPPAHPELAAAGGEQAPPAAGQEHPQSRAKAAIIIDDMGYHRRVGEELLALELNLTFSFLPHAPFTPEQEQRAYELGRDILVHLPMEAKDRKWNPGKGALLLKDSDQLLKEKTGQLLTLVPHATGANNHMGSRFTEDRAAMRAVLQVLAGGELFFVDSFTTADSTGMSEARQLGIPTARRHVFLDNVQDPDKICLQLETLTELARKEGSAIGIGHPYPATLRALSRCNQDLLAAVDLVGVHQLVQ
ncbi:divergent polysaccharide deacetylase family protein [Desulfogranum mediterraneum]|uniref:divergent polysaccharide deacetylase family protein n=1 Tax=Desulfogranum mediterraneum TaxID=160661 RepID=UPI0004209CF9|nr:divergent polysaccharide deacetylase family protein [Desulfogranum mediterraneum]